MINPLDSHDLLRADFDPSAYTVDDSRGFALTSLRPQYVVERLNEVFGLGGWQLVGEYRKEKWDHVKKGNFTPKVSVVFEGSLNLYEEDVITHSVVAIGADEIDTNLSDAYKGAKTEALSKAASWLGVGNDMFKGKIAPPNKSGRGSSAPVEKFTGKAGDYVMPLGFKGVKGEKLSNIAMAVVREQYEYWSKNAKTDSARDVAANLKKYLDSASN